MKCLRNELVPENPQTGFGVIGLLDYRINGTKKINKGHPDSLFEGYDEKNKKCMYKWINQNMEKYALRCFKEYSSGFYDGEASREIKTEKEIEELKESIERAIMCIKTRAEDLVELVKNP